jgi:hypothetical protein
MNPRNRKCTEDLLFWTILMPGLILGIICTGWYYALKPVPVLVPDNPVIVVPDNPVPPLPEPMIVPPEPVIVPPEPVIVPPEPVIVPPGPEPRCEDKTNA